LAENPCAGDLSSTAIDANGQETPVPAAPATAPPIDCFYVYPTVSRQATTNANLEIDPEERAVATAQAAQFSQDCQVYAPMYPQLTLAAVADPSRINLPAALVAYNGVEVAFADYLAHDNHGRGIVFIGHSQGAMLLIELLKTQIDPNPALRRLLVSAILPGGNVTVPVGSSVGGDFANIPACVATDQIGCVVAYSSFEATPPPDALFGRTGGALGQLIPGGSGPLEILCTNPAALGGGAGVLIPVFPTGNVASTLGIALSMPAASTPFVSYSGRFTAQCRESGGADWLGIDPVGASASADGRLLAALSYNPAWGLHTIDVNIALGNLVNLVRSEELAYG